MKYGYDSLPETIRRVIEERIIGQGLEPGVRLGLKSELQEEFGVAGPTIDQALKLLSNDGLITIRRGPGGGVFVARNHPVLRVGTKQLLARDATSLVENIELREALTSVLGASAARATDRDVEKEAELEGVIAALERTDLMSFQTQRLLWRGHQVVAALSDNATLRFIYTNLLDAAEALIVKVEMPDTDEQASHERRRVEAHLGLFRAVLAGDVEAAEASGELVRVVSPIGRSALRVGVGDEPPVQLWAEGGAGYAGVGSTDDGGEPPSKQPQ